MSLAAFLGALFSLVGVGLGALGTHALSRRLSEARARTYHTAVQYHLVHAPAAWVAGMMVMVGARSAVLQAASWAFLAGVVLFSGSLYMLAFGRLPRQLGFITPVGGFLFVAGWTLAAISMLNGFSLAS